MQTPSDTPPSQVQKDSGLSEIHPMLASFLSSPETTPDALEEFVASLSSPLVDDGVATFFWIGDADRVDLLRWINGGIDRTPFAHMSGTRLWTLRLPVENNGRFEYKIALGNNGNEEWILDPLNSVKAGDPFGENSVCRTWGYERPEWSLPQGAPSGTMASIEIDSAVFGERRQEQIYVPAGYNPHKPHPLVVIHDGEDFVTYADLTVSLDNLIAADDIPPVIAVLVQSADRMGEYPSGRRHARYLVRELLEAVSDRYWISPQPEDRILLGASLGAVVSLATAFRYPGIFGGLVLKSGSFILNDHKLVNRPHPVFHRVARLVRALRRAPDLPKTRAFVSTGELEGLAEENRALAAFLQERGVDVLFKSAWDGHHWHNWRDQLRDGLMWVLRRNE